MTDAQGWINTVATAVGSIATARAFLGTLFLLRREAARDRDTEQIRRAARENDERSQAALVSAWYGRETHRPTGEAIPAGFNRRLGVFVRNASELPVYDVTVSFIRRPLPPNRQGLYDHARVVTVSVVPPASMPLFIEAPAAILNGSGDELEGRYAVAITFTDGRGWQWRRNPWGGLARPSGQAN